MKTNFVFLAILAATLPAFAQDNSLNPNETPAGVLRERYVPADELDTVFSRDARGVMLKRSELEQLIQQARSNAAANSHPATIIVKQAHYTVEIADQQARVQAEFTVHQFVDGWQLLRIPAGNLSVEQALVDNQPAVLARAPEDPAVILVAHRQQGPFTLSLRLSTPLASAGSDQLAAFQLPAVAAVQLVVKCPAERRLLVNDRQLERPTELTQSADYQIPAGGAPDIRLRWTSRQQESQTQTLAFVRTEAAVEFRPEVMQWSGESQLSVFGGTLNRIVARVPPGFEVVHAESTGLESWTLEDDTEQQGSTRLTLTWRQPFSGDRTLLIKGVVITPQDAADAARSIPAIEFINVASHAGRLLLRHAEGLRLVAETSGGIRAVSATDVAAPAESQVFDFWQQQYRMSVAVRPRSRELYAETSATLNIRDVEATLSNSLTIEVLNAPLFEIPLVLPPDWQLTAVQSGGHNLRWTPGSTPSDIVVRPDNPVQPGSLFPLILTLQRALPDPETEQRLSLSAPQVPGVTSVGGVWTILAADDLSVVPLTLNGLTPIAGSSGQQVFRNDGTTISGELAISRKPARIASRSVLRTWADNRQQTLAAEVTVDVLSGTIRTLVVRIPESLGADVRFSVQQVGRVPGIDLPGVIQPVEVAEQSVGEPADGMRPFTIRLSNRFAGSLTLVTQAPQPRDGNAAFMAPRISVDDAVRQHGLLVFEAAPDQSLNAPPEAAAIPGLFPADASLVTPPPHNTGRRIALAWRFIRPDYSFQVAETRFDSSPVPSAVCEQLLAVSTVNESGNLQTSVTATLQTSGVQTLRFRLPNPDRSSLWSTVLNNDPVEVREADGDYLVALPAGSGSTAIKLQLLFETDSAGITATTSFEQQPVQFLIDTQNQQATLIDILQQTWNVHYPESAMLVDSKGPFRAVDGLDAPGWLQPLSKWQIPSFRQLGPQLFSTGLLLLGLFVVSALIIQKRWKSFLALTCISATLLMFTLSYRQTAQRNTSVDRFVGFLPAADGGWSESAPASAVTSNTAEDFAGMHRFGATPGAPGAFAGGEVMGGLGVPGAGMGSGGMGSGGMGGLGGMAGASLEAQQLPGSGGQPITLGRAPLSDEAETLTRNSVQDAAPANEPSSVDNIANLAQQQSQTGSADPVANASRALARRKGARLSVNVDLEIPRDYRQRSFISVADSMQQTAALQLVIRSRSQLLAFRGLTAAAILLLLSRLRRSAFTLRLSVSLAALLLALAAIPIVPPAWQGLVDGAVFGSLIGILLLAMSALANLCCGPWCPLTLCRNHCVPAFLKRSARTAAPLLLVAVLTGTAFAQPTQQPTPPASPVNPDSVNPANENNDNIQPPEIVIPTSPDQPLLRADRVFIPHDQFLKLYAAARPQELPAADVSPVGSAVVSAWLRSGALTQVNAEKYSLRFEARFAAWCDSDTPADIPLPLGPVGIHSLQVNGAEGILIPLPASSTPPQTADSSVQQAPASQQQQITANAAPQQASLAPAFAVRLAGRRLHVIDLVFDITAEVQGELGRCELPLRNPPAGTLEWNLPADGLDGRINGRNSGYRREGRTLIVPIATADNLRLQWLPMQQKAAGDMLFHAETTSALSVQDSGMLLRTAVDITVRQGEVSDLEITIPERFALQTVSGDDLAGWSILESDDGRSVIIPLRRSVTDRTTVVFQMFAPLPADELLQKFSVPISIVRGAGRDAGSVVLLAGPQFQVRSDSLSGVSQLNPDDAPRPAGTEFPGRPMLAWRYTRQPASIAVRISPTPDEQTTQAIHAVRLEEQRQLWTSRLTVLLKGTPRSRFDLAIPRTFLPLDVAATGLKDWYLTENSDPKATSRTLSIHLDDSRIGTLQIALQGQLPRDADPQLLTLQPPTLVGSTVAESQLAVWLDAASESAGLEDAGGWTLQPPTVAVTEFREIAPTQPSLAFRSSQTQPGTAIVRLRPAVSTLIAESVTVSSVTATSLEVMLALKWQIARAAADQFAVELPEALAAAMSFDVPGQRRLLREPAGEGRTRITFQLQQPAAEQFFILGTASLPLPADGRIQPAIPAFSIPANAPSTLSSQSHFLVVVNQSNALLQSDAEQPDDKVAQEQLATRIPQTLLEQAVHICRLHPGTAAWKISYPEQQKVAPAVVSLATHTTVLAEDGSWRSRHQLRVINESRQFLPVLLPPDSRLLFCTVEGRPSRVVLSSVNGQNRHLIPIPQSGSASAGFDVDFAIAGRFPDDTAALRKRLAARTLPIPVPNFPEFRDDPENGISISRNRWSVYVPESWRVVLNRTPSLTNVVESAETELQDAAVLSEVEQAISFFGRGVNKGRPMSGQYAQSTDMLNRLQQLRGSSASAEVARGDAVRKLSEFQQQQLAQAGELTTPPATINEFLFEQDLQQNRDVENSRSLFFADNGIIHSDSLGLGKAAAPPQAPQATDRFWFGLNMQLEPAKPAAPPASAAKRQDPARSAGGRDAALAEKGAAAPPTQSRLRSLLANQNVMEELRKEKLEQSDKQVKVDEFAAEQKNAPAVNSLLTPGVQQPIAPEPTATPLTEAQPAAPAPPENQGRLSLLFELPTDGVQLDFLRVGGNPLLALDIRSADSVRSAGGFAWTATCALASLLLLAAGLRGQLLTLLQITAAIAFLIGLAGLFTPSASIHTASFPLILAAATLFATARITRSFK